MKTSHAVAVIALGAAAGVAYLASRSAGPIPLPAYTELREGALQEHLVSVAELGSKPVYTPHYYPARVAPMISVLVSKGFSSMWQSDDPQIAALPAEEAN